MVVRQEIIVSRRKLLLTLPPETISVDMLTLLGFIMSAFGGNQRTSFQLSERVIIRSG